MRLSNQKGALRQPGFFRLETPQRGGANEWQTFTESSNLTRFTRMQLLQRQTPTSPI